MTIQERLRRSNLVMLVVPVVIAGVLFAAGLGALALLLNAVYLPRLGLTFQDLHSIGEEMEQVFQGLKLFVVLYAAVVLAALLAAVAFTNLYLTRALFAHIQKPLDILLQGVQRIQNGDLKSPLTTIRAYTEALLEGVAPDEAARQRYLQTIYTRETDLEALVNRLFELAKLGVREYPARLQPLQLIYLFCSGAVAITAMVLPGISGSSILLIAGVYLPTIQAVHSLLRFQLAVFPGLCALGLGVLMGIAVSIHAIRAALQRSRSAMVWLILGLMLGSLYAIVNGPASLDTRFRRCALPPSSSRLSCWVPPCCWRWKG